MPNSACSGFRDILSKGESSGRHSVHDIGHNFIPMSDVHTVGRHSVHDSGVGMSGARKASHTVSLPFAPSESGIFSGLHSFL